MNAQRGHGKRSSFYSDYTSGVWRDGLLTPISKAYFGFTDVEPAPARSPGTQPHRAPLRPGTREAPQIVLEIACDSVQRSPHHKSGLALRFPRLHRIRWTSRPSRPTRSSP
jgi:DNA ligase 1